MSRERSSTVIDQPGAVDPKPVRGPRPPARRVERAVKPFVFERLEKVEKAQLGLLKRLQWLLPDGLLTGELSEAVGVRLAKVFDEEVRLFVDYVHVAGPKTLRKIMGDPTFLGVLATSPHGSRGLIEVELGLAHNIIDLLLGAAGSEGVGMRPLTEIEDGVLSYVIIESFKALSPVSEPGRHRLRLERTLKGLEEGLDLLAEESTIAVVEFKALVGTHAGYLRILLPGSSVSAATPPEDGPVRRARRLKQVERNLPRLSGIKAYLRAEIGYAELTAGDLKGLGGGDVLLVDRLSTRADQGANGTACLRIGVGRRGRIDAAIELVNGKYTAKVEKVVLGPVAPRVPPDDEAAEKLSQAESEDVAAAAEAQSHAGDDWRTDPGVDLSDRKPTGASPWDEEETTNMTKAPESIKEDAAELLNDVPLQIAVELARIPVTAEQVVSLHVGKVLELGCAPGEPVDLSVNGKIVARGELVEIEGQLGVRLLTIAG